MPAAATTIESFPSLAAMRTAHSELMRRRSQKTERTQFLAEVAEFLERGAATGRFIEHDEDRSTAQTLLDYWITASYRETRTEIADVALAPFDASGEADLATNECPYTGTEQAREQDASLFFGREAEIRRWIAQLEKSPLLIALGPSGSGKHSFVHVGLITTLKRGGMPGSEQWRYLSVRPGTAPIEALARLELPSGPDAPKRTRAQAKAIREHFTELTRALTQEGKPPVLLVVDRFEEIFTRCGEEERTAFVESIVALAQSGGGHRVICVLLDEYASRAKEFEPLQAVFEAAEMHVPPFSAPELRAVIEKPAAQVGLKFEEGLVDRLIADVAGDPAALLLLQFTLRKLWKARDRNRITWLAYRHLGDARRALETTADELYAGMSASECQITEQIFTRMLRPGSGNSIIYSSILRETLHQGHSEAEIAEIDGVIQKLSDESLIRLSEEDNRIEAGHVALITRWPRLLQWVNEKRREASDRERLTQAADQWRQSGRDAGALWSGTSLAEARRKYPAADLNDLERRFLEASLDDEERTFRRRRRFRRMLISGGFLIAGVGLSMLGYHFVNERRQVARMFIERGEQLLEANDPAGATIWFSAAFDHRVWFLDNAQIGRMRIAATMRQSPRLAEQWPQARLTHAEMSGDGTSVITTGSPVPLNEPDKGDEDHITARLWKTQPGKAIALVREEPVNWGTFSSDSQWLATGHGKSGETGRVCIWKAADGARGEAIGTSGAVTCVAFPKKNRGPTAPAARSRVAVTIAEVRGSTPAKAAILVWDFEAKKFWRRESDLPLNGIEFGPGGDEVLVACGNSEVAAPGAAIVWRYERDEVAIIPHDSPVQHAEFSPDGTRLVTASGASDAPSGEARVWITASLWTGGVAKAHTLPLPHLGSVKFATFSPDGKRVVSAGNDNTARLWDIEGGRALAVLAHQGWVFDARFSPDGRLLATASRDRLARIWNTSSGKQILTSLNHSGTVTSAAFSSDGRRVMAAGKDVARVWEIATAVGPPPLFNPQDEVEEAIVSGDGERVLTVAGRAARCWSRNGQALSKPMQMPGSIKAQALSQDGSRCLLAYRNADRTYSATVLNVADGTEVARPQVLPAPPTRAAFAHRSAGLAAVVSRPAGALADTVQLWTLETESLVSFEPGVTVGFLDFDSDDRWLLTCGADEARRGEARLWDKTGKQVGQTMHHTEDVKFASFNSTSELLVTASADNTAAIWKIPSGEAKRTPLRSLHTADLACARFSADDTRLLTTSFDGTAVVCDWRSWKEGTPIVSLQHEAAVVAGSFSGDGCRVLTASADGTARVWDARAGTIIARLRHRGEIRSAAFAENDSKVVALSIGGLGEASTAGPQAGATERAARRVEARVWDVSDLPNVKTLYPAAEVVAARTSDQSNRLATLPGTRLDEIWKQGSAAYLADFKRAESMEFHRRRAALSEADEEWFAAEWHLARVIDAETLDRELLVRAAHACDEQLRWPEAVAYYDRALKNWPLYLDPGARATALTQLAWGNIQLKQWAAANAACDELIKTAEKEPFQAPMLRALVALEEQEQLPPQQPRDLSVAIDSLKKATQLAEGASASPWQRLAAAQLRSGKIEEWRETCHQIEKVFGASSEKDRVTRFVWPWLLAPVSGIDLGKYLAPMEQEIKAHHESYRINTLGAARYRVGAAAAAAGDLERARKAFEAAIVDLDESCKAFRQENDAPMAAGNSVALIMKSPANGRPQDWLFLAMAHYQLKHLPEAAAWLRQADEAINGERERVGMESTAPRRAWNRIELEMLLQEATQLISGKRNGRA